MRFFILLLVAITLNANSNTAFTNLTKEHTLVHDTHKQQIRHLKNQRELIRETDVDKSELIFEFYKTNELFYNEFLSNSLKDNAK